MMRSITRIVLILTLPGLLTPGLCGEARAQSTTQETPSKKTFTISGSTGLPGVKFKGLPGEYVSDNDGKFVIEVPNDLSGYVMPVREGYTFDPPFVAFSPTNRINNVNFTARADTVTISGNVGVGNAFLKVLPGHPVAADSQGNYQVRVEYGWSGKLMPERRGYEFNPRERSYRRVQGNVTGEDYTVKVAPYGDAGAGLTADDVLVIPTREVSPPQFTETIEDMRVMLQILREKLSEPRMILGVLYDYGDFFGRNSRDARALYLQGYGVLFLLEVDFPFSFPPELPAGDGQEQTTPVDPIWERARQNLYTPRNQAGYGSRGRPGESREMDFNQFQEDLLQTLRHAANIRNVEPNEWVILTVIAQRESGWPSTAGAGGAYGGGGMWFEGGSYSTSGSSFGPTGGSTHADSATRSSGSTAGRSGPRPGQPAPTSAGSTTVLTIQARKADIDAFGRGELGFDQFRLQVRTFTY